MLHGADAPRGQPARIHQCEAVGALVGGGPPARTLLPGRRWPPCATSGAAAAPPAIGSPQATLSPSFSHFPSSRTISNRARVSGKKWHCASPISGDGGAGGRAGRCTASMTLSYGVWVCQPSHLRRSVCPDETVILYSTLAEVFPDPVKFATAPIMPARGARPSTRPP